MTFIKFNMNPFEKETSDCVTRALVAATKYGYKTIAKMLGLEMINGIGVNGITPPEFLAFSKKTGLVTNVEVDIGDNWDIPQREYLNFMKYKGFSMGTYLRNLTPEVLGGDEAIFLVKMKPDDAIPMGDTTKFHAIYGNVRTKTYVDLQDTKDQIVFDIYVADKAKQCKKRSSRYFIKEDWKLWSENRRYIVSRFRKDDKDTKLNECENESLDIWKNGYRRIYG
jgi:hypothetical protein